ncbi:hypothetical protein [Aquihabitans sp. McL0605]|uniref:hypothetical protein n=1 Tax=Aquihabitans sp. McL0605 TaxID=3415671 RepID=UPI003CFB0C6C
MTDPHARITVVLDRLPTDPFRAAVLYLDDARRECQLVLVAHEQGLESDPDLVAVAEGLIPDIEEMDDALTASDVTVNDDGTTRLVGSLEVSQAGTLAHLQMQLVQLRLIERRGGLLLESDPHLAQLLAWIWDELADQLHGRPPRAYRPAT